MKKISILSIAFIYLSLTSVFAQEPVTKATPTILQSHICNSQATYFPKPDYSKIDTNILGGVNVVIKIDEEGNVKSASAVSGHPFLRKEAEEAALKAKFKPIIFEGKPVAINCLLFYQFTPPTAATQNEESKQTENLQEKVIKVGIVNGKATYLPKPKYSQEAKDFCASGKVEVEVLIGEDGNVISAKAVSGDELLRNSAIEAAKKAKFRQIADNLLTIYL